MPRYDQTGPMGEGPMTGWGQGRCGSDKPDRTGAGYGRAAGRGRGGGRRGGMRQAGMGRRAAIQSFAGGNEEVENRDMLISQVDELRKSLAAVKEQLARIKQPE